VEPQQVVLRETTLLAPPPTLDRQADYRRGRSVAGHHQPHPSPPRPEPSPGAGACRASRTVFISSPWHPRKSSSLIGPSEGRIPFSRRMCFIQHSTGISQLLEWCHGIGEKIRLRSSAKARQIQRRNCHDRPASLGKCLPPIDSSAVTANRPGQRANELPCSLPIWVISPPVWQHRAE